MGRYFLAHAGLALALLGSANVEAVAATPGADLAAFKAAIRKQYDMKERAFAARDPKPIVETFYSADAVSVSAAPEVVDGRAAFADDYKKYMETFSGTIRIVSWRSHVNGNSGFDWTNFEIIPPGATAPVKTLKILFLWERRNGKWVSLGDMIIPGRLPIGADTVPTAARK